MKLSFPPLPRHMINITFQKFIYENLTLVWDHFYSRNNFFRVTTEYYCYNIIASYIIPA